jgi:hypothetical protein
VFAMSAAHVIHKGTLLALGLALIALGCRRSTAQPFPARLVSGCGASRRYSSFSLCYMCATPWHRR